MDSVRFGRALGVGARAAAKTLMSAAEAAASANPSSTQKAKTQGAGTRTSQQVARTAAQARQTARGVSEGGKRLGESAWRPFVRLSGVLWLEFTGVFFGIFAAY